MSVPLHHVSAVRVPVEGLDHPEGLALGLDGAVYAGGEAGQLYRLAGWREALTGGAPAEAEQFATTGGFVLGLALDGGGHVYACDHRRHQVLRCPRRHRLGLLRRGAGDGAADAELPGLRRRAGALRLRLRGLGARRRLPLPHRPGGETQVVATAPCHFPERPGPLAGRGLALRRRVDATRGDPPAHPADALGAPEEVVRLPGTVPDGLASTPKEPSTSPATAPTASTASAPGGAIDVLADDPAGTALAAPTNVAFLGDGWLGVANLGRWHLAGRPVQAPGAPCATRTCRCPGSAREPRAGHPTGRCARIYSARKRRHPKSGTPSAPACWRAGRRAPGPGRRLS